MMVNGKYHYICIVPQEWNLYARDDLELYIFKSLRDYFTKNGKINGSVTTIGEITTKTENWNLKLWLKKVSDRKTYPDSESYFWMLLDWRPCPDEILVDMPHLTSVAPS
uniref:Uncharacterized protein n=1 Tax=Glyptapanteles indiensis TaxID=92994 RepID=B7S955_GLYIN|nr:hypothetical protein GIP_L8_0440 [Glyptapanteles indiensis]